MARDDDLRQRLEDEPEIQPRAWRGGPGEVICGTVISYGTGTAQTQKGPKVHPTVIIETDEAELVKVWLLHQVLLDEFREQRPKPGERVGIKRLEDSSKGYARYTVIVDREDSDPLAILDRYGDAGDVPRDDRRAALASARTHREGNEETEQELDDDLPF